MELTESEKTELKLFLQDSHYPALTKSHIQICIPIIKKRAPEMMLRLHYRLHTFYMYSWLADDKPGPWIPNHELPSLAERGIRPLELLICSNYEGIDLSKRFFRTNNLNRIIDTTDDLVYYDVDYTVDLMTCQSDIKFESCNRLRHVIEEMLEKNE